MVDHVQTSPWSGKLFEWLIAREEVLLNTLTLDEGMDDITKCGNGCVMDTPMVIFEGGGFLQRMSASSHSFVEDVLNIGNAKGNVFDPIAVLTDILSNRTCRRKRGS